MLDIVLRAVGFVSLNRWESGVLIDGDRAWGGVWDPGLCLAWCLEAGGEEDSESAREGTPGRQLGAAMVSWCSAGRKRRCQEGCSFPDTCGWGQGEMGSGIRSWRSVH